MPAPTRGQAPLPDDDVDAPIAARQARRSGARSPARVVDVAADESASNPSAGDDAIVSRSRDPHAPAWIEAFPPGSLLRPGPTRGARSTAR